MTSPEIIRLAVMMYVRFPLSPRQVEDLLHQRGSDVSQETVGSGGTGLAHLWRARSANAGVSGFAR
jgi:transposase-like protein